MRAATLDPATHHAVRTFLDRVGGRHAVQQAIVFGSRARQDHRADSDADLAVVITGPHATRASVAMDLAGIAFEVLVDTGILVEALPLWADELAQPEHFHNPALLANIRRDGVVV